MRERLNVFLPSSVLKFLAVGGMSTGIDFILYMVLSVKLPLMFAKGISMIVSSIFSYIANKSFTFKNKEKTNVKYLFKFYIVFGTNFATNLIVNYLIYKYTGFKIIAFIIATICGMTINYLGQRFFVFKK